MAPTPNPANDKRDREYGWTYLPNSGPDEPAPELVGAFDNRARVLWAKWWATPMARMWGREFDVSSLERLLGLYQQSWSDHYNANGDPVNVPGIILSEIRQMEDRFGLTPSARRKLFWAIDGVDRPAVDEKIDEPSKERSLPRAGGDADPRKLRAIEGGKKAAG